MQEKVQIRIYPTYQVLIRPLAGRFAPGEGAGRLRRPPDRPRADAGVPSARAPKRAVLPPVSGGTGAHGGVKGDPSRQANLRYKLTSGWIRPIQAVRASRLRMQRRVPTHAGVAPRPVRVRGQSLGAPPINKKLTKGPERVRGFCFSTFAFRRASCDDRRQTRTLAQAHTRTDMPALFL